MIFEDDGVQKKLVCPSCKSDASRESGLGGGLLHCFGRCMADIPRQDCLVFPVQTQAEADALSQSPY
jgi:hypothetical protein